MKRKMTFDSLYQRNHSLMGVRTATSRRAKIKWEMLFSLMGNIYNVVTEGRHAIGRNGDRSFSGCRSMACTLTEEIGPPAESSDEEVNAWFFNKITNLFKLEHASISEIRKKPRLAHPSAYNKLMKTFGRPGEVDEVLRIFREMKESKCFPNVLCYNTVIDALVMGNCPEDAEMVFEEMISSGVVPNVSSFNILVKLYSYYLKQFDMAYEVIQRMAKFGCRPDMATFSTMITGLCREGRIGEAWGVLDWMLEEKCLPTVQTYTPIMQGYCSEGKIEEARQLMSTMESVGCPPNSVTYNILIDALCKIGSFDEVEKLFRESASKGWKPNVVTYNTYMNGLCKSGKPKEAFEQLGVMLENGLYPTAYTLNILLDCLCRDSNFWEAKCLLEWSSELEWYDSAIGFNTLMSRLSGIGRSLDVLKLLTDMFKKGIIPNTRTFNIVINSLCKSGKLRKAKCIFNSKGFVANVATYNTLIYWFYLNRKISEVQILMSSMSAEKIAPDKITYSIMVYGLCTEEKFLKATTCFLGSLVDSLDLDLAVFLINKLVKRRRFEEVLHLFEGMMRQGYAPDSFIFQSSITAFCREGFCQSKEIYTVCLILDKILKMP